jgi:hypothetical protein
MMELLTGQSNGQNLRMCGGIVCRRNSIRAFGNDIVVFCDDATERSAAPGANVLDRKLDGARHERAVHVSRFHHRVIIKGVRISATPDLPRK